MIGRIAKSRLGFMQTVSKMMTVVITAVTVLTVAPPESHAMAGIDPITAATTEVSGDNTAVTVSFNTYALPTNSLADLMSNIQIERSGSDEFVDLTADSASNAISMDAAGALVITFGTALTGSENSLYIAAGSIKNQADQPSVNDLTLLGITAHDITPPAFIGASSNNGRSVYLNFDEDFSVNAPEDADEEQSQDYLISKLSVATDGVHFVPVAGQQGSFYQNGSRQIYLNYDNDMKVIMGSNTVIRIASGTLKDAAGNLNEEMDLHVSPPLIQSAVVSSDNHDVTITFDGDVVNNTGLDASLKNYIYLVKGPNSNWKGLVTSDTVSMDSGKLHIHFAEALSGTTNQIIINGGVLKDLDGNIQNEDVVTALLEVGDGGVDPAPADTTAPSYLYSYESNNNQDINFVFDEEVFNAAEDAGSFLQNVQWYDSINNQWRYTLPSDATLTFSGSTFTLHFAAPLTGYQYYFRIYGNHFKDAAGNVLNQDVNTNWIYPQNSEAGISFDGGYFSHDGRFLSLEFNSNTDLVDQTLVDGVSHLNEQITISTDQGLTYAALNALDVVYVQGDKLNIIFHDAKQVGSVKVKVAADVLSDQYNTKRNAAVETLIAYNTPDFTGYFFSNTTSEFVFADNVAWREHVRSISVYDSNLGRYRTLNSSEYALSEGKLTFAKGVFQEGQYYQISVDAEGYSSKYFEGRAYKSSEIFYVTAPMVSADNGITATINLFNNAYDDEVNGTQTIVFELFDGATPISVVAANLRVDTGTYSANFNVSDAAVNPNYTVKAYVVSRYSNDSANLGLNLATVKTQIELDQAILDADQNNNRND